MADIELSLEDGLRLAGKESADADVRTLGALTVAAILINAYGAGFRPDMLGPIENLIGYLADNIPQPTQQSAGDVTP